MEEIWRDVEGFEGYYQVSNLGRVKSLERTIYKVIPEKILSVPLDAYGYPVVCLRAEDRKQRNFTVHRLVAKTFISNPNNYKCVNHLNENKADNHINNLEWCTYKENNNHGTRNTRIGNSLKVTNQIKRRRI